MNISQLNNFPFPKEVLKLISNDVIRFVLGDSYDEILVVKGKEFFVPKENLLRDRRATTILMWSSGYYYASITGRLFGVSRESQSKYIQKIERDESRKIARLKWLTLGEVRQGPLDKYVFYYIRRGKIDCRYVLGRKFVNPKGYDLLIKSHRKMLSKKVCPICGKKSPRNKYCSGACKSTAARRKNSYKNNKHLTWKNCPNLAKPIFELSHSDKQYKDEDFLFYHEAAEALGITFAAIFYWTRKKLFTVRKLKYINAVGHSKMKTAVPKEQVELFRQLNPHIKSRPPVS